MSKTLPEYLESADAVLFGQTPMLMVPREGVLPPLGDHQRRYLAANDGIYVHARVPGLHACVRLANIPLPYGPLPSGGPFVKLNGGPVDGQFWRQIVDEAVARCPREIAALIAWRHSTSAYELIWPDVSSSSGVHITYREISSDPDLVLVMDIHSHGNGRAFFSAVDDASDQMRLGPHISVVLGRCEDPARIEASARLCVGAHLVPMKHILFEGVDQKSLVAAHEPGR